MTTPATGMPHGRPTNTVGETRPTTGINSYLAAKIAAYWVRQGKAPPKIWEQWQSAMTSRGWVYAWGLQSDMLNGVPR